jgi:hypothetical protein
MYTVYDFYKGMFCELGGEFVDTGHEDLQKLGAELGVEGYMNGGVQSGNRAAALIETLALHK